VVAETNVFATDAYAPPAHLTKYAILGIALGWTAYALIYLISLVTLTYYLAFRTNTILNNKLNDIRTLAVSTYALDIDVIDGEFEEIWRIKSHKEEKEALV
jgi:hypothetical protein